MTDRRTAATDTDHADLATAIPPDEAVEVTGGLAIAAEQLGHSTQGPTRRVWRVTGRDGASWILKVVEPRDDERSDASRRPTSYQFWAREPAVLASGPPPAYLEAGLRSPRLLARFERPDGGVALWIESVAGRTPATPS